MIDTNVESTCKVCGKPVDQVPGRRKREFCSDTCRQRYHRAKSKPVEVQTDDNIALTSELEELRATVADQAQYIVALEQRIAALEKRGKAQKRRDLVSLDRFIASHGLTHLDYQRAINAGALQPPEEIKQKDGTIIQCLDSEGRRAFYEALHHSVPTWISCPICPHELV